TRSTRDWSSDVCSSDLDLSRMTSMESANMTWDFFKRVRDITRMKILVKGILAHEDATLCVENGLDGLIVSNHGARGEDSGRSTRSEERRVGKGGGANGE